MATPNQVDLFFDNPAELHQPPRSYGVLYLLRRDIDTCLGVSGTERFRFLRMLETSNDISQYAEKAVAKFTAAMGILAGIDLLAKFFEGKDEPTEVGKRFKAFIGKYLDVDDNGSKLIWLFRNSLLHSYGLYATDKDGEYHFVATYHNGPIARRIDGDRYQIDIARLYYHFERAIEAYRNDVNEHEDLAQRFDKMYPYYGNIIIAG